MMITSIIFSQKKTMSHKKVYLQDELSKFEFCSQSILFEEIYYVPERNRSVQVSS